MEDERQMKELQLKQLRLQNRNKLAEMQLNLKVMEMELARKKLEMQNEMYLDSLGASTKDKVSRAQLNYEVNRLELEEQREKYKNMLELRDADESVKKLELEIFRKEILEKQRTLQDAQIRSPRKAVLSYVNTEIGTQVHAGTKIAVITEPGSYKVEGEIADSYAAKLAPGNEVIVLIDQKPLQGIVSQVAPLSKSGMISFTVKLADESNPLLRAGMRADIYIVNACRTDVVRIRNSGFYTKPGSYDLCGVYGDQLGSREVQLGDCNYDLIEVKSGLDPGEIVLVNNFEKYLTNTKMKLKNMKTIRI